MPSCTRTHKSNRCSASDCCKGVSDEDISEQNVFSRRLEITMFLKTDLCRKKGKQGWEQKQQTKHLKTPYDPNPIEEENVSTALLSQSSTFFLFSSFIVHNPMHQSGFCNHIHCYMENKLPSCKVALHSRATELWNFVKSFFIENPQRKGLQGPLGKV